MKYIIPNERLVKIMNNYFDNLMDNYDISKFDTFITLYKKDENDFSTVIIEYDYDDGRLYINKSIFDDFINSFPVYPDDVENLIKDWFENKFGVEVYYVRVS